MGVGTGVVKTEKGLSFITIITPKNAFTHAENGINQARQCVNLE